MSKKKKTTPPPAATLLKNKFDELIELIEEYADSCRADEMKGGSDPADMPAIEAYCELMRLKVNAHIEKMRREYE